MICLEARHFNLNKILLQATGLWPYQQTKLVRIQFAVLFGILATAIIFQLTTFITTKSVSNFIIKNLPTALALTIALIKYTSFHVHVRSIKVMLTELQNMYNGLKEKNEKAIIEKYGDNANRYTAMLTSFTVSSMSVFILGQIWPSILDIVLPKNESRPCHLHIAMEYFLDQEKYFYFILFHLNAGIFIGMITTVATGAMGIAYLQYVCGMFMIASYRLENAMKIDMLKNINKNLILMDITRAVDMHRQAMKLCDFLINRFEILFFCLIVFGVICLSLNLLRIFQTTWSADAKEFVLPILGATICILYMFIANYVGQDTTDHNVQIYITAYNIQWYKAPLQVQTLILFILQRGIKSFTLSIGGLFDASFECFATLVKASVSYFMFVYTTR
ncbi:hypothetical protein HN011_005410 [Eciton burchellii]|nr:hypothetical protein HN011_005410 [Eciton burchellii]